MPTGKKLDLTGQRFGFLTVLRRATREEIPRRHDTPSHWLVRCDCGVERLAIGKRLISGVTKICARNGHSFKSYNVRGLARMGTVSGYKSWDGARQRCFNPNDDSFADYGGRGITMCDRWRESFDAFLADMGPRPSSDHTIERINNDSDYEPGNCRWATAKEQARNTRRSFYVEYRGVRRLLLDVCEDVGAPYSAVAGRLRGGWSLEKALTQPVKHYRRHNPLARLTKITESKGL